MKQFILENAPGNDGIVRLQGGDYRYLVRVRRLAPGEFFPAVLPCGGETLVQILSIESGILTGKCAPPDSLTQDHPTNNDNINEKNSASIPPIILFQAMPKGDKMDLIVRQAAEGAITEIVPFYSEFSLAKVKSTGKRSSNSKSSFNSKSSRFTRWERIIKEARQQSGSKTATVIREPLSIEGLFDYWGEIKKKDALGLLFHHQPLEKQSLHGYLSSNPCVVALAIGPEGGFSPAEVSLFLENGFKPLTIGNTILRTETAALYCAAAVKVLLLERETWEMKLSNTNNG
ncbi:MAG: 16S rRNA (uracil(1498)-N(3))-methyltransferase [Treponema sp.]|jgi:16S rRNA (uracil1498-N3)-methyltransferase|nr:16S rRNA (uracil(1498)-N(3))-methyltransferase [Treponema sp.]